LTHHHADDAFHEIQLNGKQLVFLFMAATVVSVVIFLCGVLVGRGVRAERGEVADDVLLDQLPVADSSLADPNGRSNPVATGSDPRTAPPPPPAEDLSYFNRLERDNSPAEQLKPAPGDTALPTPADEPPASRAAAAAPIERTPATEPAVATRTAPESSSGFVVQIAALNDRREADAMARRLSSKGYAAYVVSPAGGTPAVYRVRIGTFKTRREADTMAAKLQKEERFKPWVTR
jgi:cell division septation protein DedD